MKRVLLVLAAFLVLSAPGDGQLIRNQAVTVAQLPSAGAVGRLRAVTDGASATDCSSGLGSHKVLCMDDGDSWEWVGAGAGGAQNLFETFAAPSGTNPVADSATDTLTFSATSPLAITGNATTDTLAFSIATASTSAAGACELATSVETTAGLCVQASDSRLADARTPAGAAGGALSGTYPSPSLSSDSVTLGTHTTGGYAGSATESGPATSALTAGALAANGTNCSSGQAAQGTDAAGNAEGCFTAGNGDVVGPASATAEAVAAYSSASGKLLKNTAVLITSSSGVQVGGSSGPIMRTLGAGITSFFQSDDTSWALLNAQGIRAIDGAGTIKALVKPEEMSLAMGVCLNATSSASAGAGDTTLCRASAGAWATDGLRWTPRSSPIVTCGSASTAGYVYFDTDSTTFCGCNGTAWVAMGGPGPCA